MARKKIVASSTAESNTPSEIADSSLSEKLGTAFNMIIKRDFGNYIAPSPIVTPTGIVPLDYLLGGGIVSSKPVMISSTPETGLKLAC